MKRNEVKIRKRSVRNLFSHNTKYGIDDIYILIEKADSKDLSIYTKLNWRSYKIDLESKKQLLNYKLLQNYKQKSRGK